MSPKEILELFDEKFSRLQSSKLMDFMNNQGWKFSFNFTTNGLESDATFPDLEYVESYILNLRFFIQDKEAISIKNLKKLYDENCLDSDVKENFNELRELLNSELDKPIHFLFNKNKLTFRDVFEGFIYSRLAHSNVNKHTLFQESTKSTFGYYFAFDYFLRCISLVHNTLISNLNKKAFPSTGEVL